MVEEIEQNEKHLTKIFVGLTGLILLLAGIIVLVFILQNIHQENPEEETLMSVAGFEWNVNDKLLNSPDYTTDDVINEYENELKKGDLEYQFEVAMSYASFLNDRLNLTEKAISVIEAFDGKLEDDNSLLNYHVTLRDLYGDLNDSEKVRVHDEEIVKLRERIIPNTIKGEDL